MIQNDFSEEHDCFNRGLWYPGNSIFKEDGSTTVRFGYNFIGCRDLCLEDSGCVGITYEPKEDKCYLKSAMIEKETSERPDLISWQRFCYGKLISFGQFYLFSVLWTKNSLYFLVTTGSFLHKKV